MKVPLPFLLILFAILPTLTADAQEVDSAEVKNTNQKTPLESATSIVKKLKLSGYIQAQYQLGEKDATLKVGSPNENYLKSFSRIGIRRGRFKLVFDDKLAMATLQVDANERDALKFKTIHLDLKDPWGGASFIRMGVFNRTFGNELSYSSALRESPEFSTTCQTLFPDEADLGAALFLRFKPSSPLSFIRLEAGLFAGNGAKAETDSRRDFIGHISLQPELGNGNINFSLGASYYHGSVYQGSSNVYTMEGTHFKLSSSPDNEGNFAKREYVGFDAKLALKSSLGHTRLRAEYLFGQQPGSKTSTKSPNTSTRPSYDTYIRNFNGGYAMVSHGIHTTPVAVVAKYEWYDPNTKVSKDEVGVNGTGLADVFQSSLGFGLLWDITSYLRLQAYYEISTYEETKNVEVRNTLAGNLELNVCTLRLQYKF